MGISRIDTQIASRKSTISQEEINIQRVCREIEIAKSELKAIKADKKRTLELILKDMLSDDVCSALALVLSQDLNHLGRESKFKTVEFRYNKVIFKKLQLINLLKKHHTWLEVYLAKQKVKLIKDKMKSPLVNSVCNIVATVKKNTCSSKYY